MFSRITNIALIVVATSCPNAFADVIDGEELVDPTRPFFLDGRDSTGDDEGLMAMIRNVVPASYEVTFIRANGSSPMAVVNDQQVSLGDVIGGATVVAIDRSGVTLSVNDQEQIISLYGTSVKSPVVDQ